MFKINKKIEYALIVLKHFDRQELGAMATARQICDSYHTPFDTTSKVMQTMSHFDILSSAQGVKGGYQLNKNLSLLSYLQLAEIIEGKKFDHDCTNIQCSLIETCNITGPISRLNDYLNSVFKNLSIKELLDEKPSPVNLIQKSVAEL